LVKLKIVLVNPLIPQNTGNIARLCAANDLELHLAGKLGFSLDDKHMKRAGLDYWVYVKLSTHDSFDDFLDAQKKKTDGPADPRFFIFTKKAERDLFELSFKDGDILVFGPEDKGFSPDFLCKYSDNTVKIPMQSPNVRSLNLSSSVAIASYEAMRQIKNCARMEV
jgi:tRNA (cytidine/uridine-2'-O-)-methyltransferase